MISVVQGRIGSCKSYYCTKTAIAHLRAGGVVATNMALDLEQIRRIYHRHIAPWQLLRVSADSDPREIPVGDFRGHGRRRVLVILDEALNWFASEGRATSDNRKLVWSEWLRQSDKLGQDVWFVAQNFERAAKWIRELAQVAYDCINFGQVRLWGMPLGRWCHLNRLAMVVRWDVRSKQRLGVQMLALSPDVWRCYDTAELYGFRAAESAFLASVPPAYHPPGLRLLLVPVAFLFVRLIVEAVR